MSPPAGQPIEYRALVCVTTCQRLALVRRYLPHFARFCVEDPRFALLVALDGTESDTLRFCDKWEIPLVYSDEREGVGISKNRVLERFDAFDYYFFVEDDVELVDRSVFPAHVELSRASGIHHFSLSWRGEVRGRTGESHVAGRRIAHGRFGSADFSFYTGAGLRQVGGWHPRFAQYRRWGHTEHTYRFYRAGLTPAPFNVAASLASACIWHSPPPVTRIEDVAFDQDQIAAPERELMAAELRHVPIETLSEHHINGFAPRPPTRLARTLDTKERYPLAEGAELRRGRSGYHLWRFENATSGWRRGAALLAAAWNWPGNPALRHSLKTALRA